jgi:hypothetical protein
LSRHVAARLRSSARWAACVKVLVTGTVGFKKEICTSGDIRLALRQGFEEARHLSLSVWYNVREIPR